MKSKQLRKHHQRKCILNVKLLRHLYRSVNGRELSLDYRKTNADINDASLTFGEIVPQSFLQILQETNDSSNSRCFVDLGSGIGRACMCAALSPFGFTKIIGIEIIPILNESSVSVHQELLNLIEYNKNRIISDKSEEPNQKSTGKTTVSIENSIIDVLDSCDDKMQSIQTLANDLCKIIGHKAYKSSISPHKSFLKYLMSKSDIFNVSEEGLYVSLNLSLNLDNYNYIEDSEDEISIKESGQCILLDDDDISALLPLPEVIFLNSSIFDIPWC